MLQQCAAGVFVNLLSGKDQDRTDVDDCSSGDATGGEHSTTCYLMQRLIGSCPQDVDHGSNIQTIQIGLLSEISTHL